MTPQRTIVGLGIFSVLIMIWTMSRFMLPAQPVEAHATITRHNDLITIFGTVLTRDGDPVPWARVAVRQSKPLFHGPFALTHKQKILVTLGGKLSYWDGTF